MEKASKQRLVGAVAIVSLAVIVLPVLFDGSGYRQLFDMKLDTPAQPHLLINQELDALDASRKAGVKKIYTEIDLKNPTVSAKKQWVKFIQVDAFEQRAQAEKMTRDLMGKKYLAQIREEKNDGRKRFIVEVVSSNPKTHTQLLKRLEKALQRKDFKLRQQQGGTP